jgi:hypothetical protein
VPNAGFRSQQLYAASESTSLPPGTNDVPATYASPNGPTATALAPGAAIAAAGISASAPSAPAVAASRRAVRPRGCSGR